MNMTRELTFTTSPVIIGLALTALLAVIGLAFWAWRKSGFDRGIGLLELLRIVICTMAAVTLCQPEWKEVYRPTERPTLAVLYDDSASMETSDVLSPTDPTAEPTTRSAWLQKELEAIDWSKLGEEVDVVQEKFSSQANPSVGHVDPRQATDIDTALGDSLKKFNNLRAVLLVSDGDWNEGEAPANAATRLRINKVPVYTAAIGSEVALPDIEVSSLEPPTFSVVGKSLQIPFTVRSTIAVDYEVEVALTMDSGQELTKQIVVPAMGQVQDVFFWTPSDLGDVQLTLDVPAHPQESIRGNNTKTVKVSIKAESLKVLVVESLPRWEYRYLRNALERDPGVDVSCLLFHPGLSKRGGGSGYIKEFPATIEELSKYDVVFLGDVGMVEGQLTAAQCEMIRGLVENQASGLIFMPGPKGYQYSLQTSELAELYPVVLDESARRGFGSRVPSNFILTELGQNSLLTKLADTAKENAAVWRSLPGFQWRSPALRHKAGTEVLAVHEESRAPLLVTKTMGTGKILFMGTDGAWRWREGVEDKYHYRFWGQVARWMAYQRHMAEGEMLRFFYSPDRPEPGNVVTMNATVLDPSGVPMNGGTVSADISSPSGQLTKLRFQQAEGADWGLYSARFTPDQIGQYKVTLRCNETSAVLEAEVGVQGKQKENIGKPARHDVMREIAKITRAETIAYDQLETICDRILELPPPEPTVRRKQIWASPYWAGTLLILLTAFWIGRKAKGAI